MNPAYNHLLFNHFPVIGTLIGLGALLYALLIKNDVVAKTAYVIIIIMTLFSFPAYFSGEGAEEVVEKIEGVSHDAIEAHEDIAKTAFILMLITGALAAFALYLEIQKSALSNILRYVVLTVSIICFVLMVNTGLTGGKIRHTETNDKTTTESSHEHESEGDDD